MQKQVLTALLPVMMAVLTLIGGCGKQSDNSEKTVSLSDTQPQTSDESYNCSSLDNSNPLKQSWCQAKALFDHKEGMKPSADSLKQYVSGFRHGINDARQAKASRISRFITDDRKESPEDSGYRDGYQSVVTQLGLIEFDCRSDGEPSEYRERWCEAADSYRIAGIGGDNNPFLRNRYVDGYMAGGRVALTVPTSMESFFSGDAPEGKQPAIIPPEGDLMGTELAFYRGFDEGYKAMIASIRESINQVMEQMQVPNNMQFPDGMAPPAPPEE